MIHLYAFALDVGALDGVEGIDGAAVQVQAIGDVTAVVSRITVAPDSHDSILRHGAVVDAVADRAAAVLPVRFGERFDDDDALVAAVATRLPELRRRLHFVRGRVELGVRIGLRTVRETSRDRRGSGYMQARAAKAARVSDAARRLELDVRAFADDTVARPGGTGSDIHRAAFLVSRELVSEFAAAVDRFARANDDLAVLCTGPWAPYNFAEAA